MSERNPYEPPAADVTGAGGEAVLVAPQEIGRAHV